jgi:ribosomal protein S18 acetylase RimI-like enzyme
MIRPAQPTDVATLVTLTRGTGFFKPLELQALDEVLADYFDTNAALGHHCATLEVAGQAVGYVYVAPAAMTVGTWYLWWIAVAKERQHAGLGTQLLQHGEQVVRQNQGRHLFIETGSTPLYEPTRRFYLRHGYEVAATLPDYYDVGDSMIVFRKAFA